jgi:hypothetical protein
VPATPAAAAPGQTGAAPGLANAPVQAASPAPAPAESPAPPVIVVDNTTDTTGNSLQSSPLAGRKLQRRRFMRRQ